MKHIEALDRSRIRLGTQLGMGGQGKVWELLTPQRIDGIGPLAYKEYHTDVLNSAALNALIDFPFQLPTAERTRLLHDTAWPLRPVQRSGTIIGFAMPRIPQEFTAQVASGTCSRDLQYLLFEPKPAWQSVGMLSISGRIQLAARFVSLLALLNRRGIILGDISHGNVLWRASPAPDVFLVDCDSARQTGKHPVLKQPETPDWDDPLPAVGSLDQHSDRYKAALLVGRLLTRDKGVRPGERLTFLPSMPPLIAARVRECFAAAASADRTQRPCPAAWAAALQGRELIAMHSR